MKSSATPPFQQTNLSPINLLKPPCVVHAGIVNVDLILFRIKMITDYNILILCNDLNTVSCLISRVPANYWFDQRPLLKNPEKSPGPWPIVGPAKLGPSDHRQKSTLQGAALESVLSRRFRSRDTKALKPGHLCHYGMNHLQPG